jgi:hypothetical protein
LSHLLILQPFIHLILVPEALHVVYRPVIGDQTAGIDLGKLPDNPHEAVVADVRAVLFEEHSQHPGMRHRYPACNVTAPGPFTGSN